MTDLRFGRRRLLQAAAASTASLPLLRALEGSRPMRREPAAEDFICIYHPHGVAAEFWAHAQQRDRDQLRPRVRGLLAVALRRRARPTARASRTRSLIVEGLDLLSNANGHDSAGTILTGSRIERQEAAQRLARSVPGGRARPRREHAGHQHRARRRQRRQRGGLRRCRTARAARRCPRSSIRCRPSTSLFGSLVVRQHDPARAAAAEQQAQAWDRASSTSCAAT